MTGDPLVSVLVPAYNRKAYIDEAIGSVLAQTHKSFELIVIDDGSTDGTYELLQSYGSKLTLLTHPGRVNLGQSASINAGLRSAKGKYVAILDSDDYWEPHKLAIQVDFLEKNREVGLVYSNGYMVNSKGKILYAYHSEKHEEKNDPNMILLDCYMALPVNSLVRRSVYERAGMFEVSFRASQDHDMLLRIAEVTTFSYLPDHLFYYRRHEDSISKMNQDVRWRTGFEILRRAKQRYPYKGIIIRKRRALLYYRMAQVHQRRQEYFKALRCIMKAGLLDPKRSLKVITGLESKV